MRIVALILVRLAWFVPTLAGLIAVVFLISRVIPSDPVALLAGETASRAQIEAVAPEARPRPAAARAAPRLLPPAHVAATSAPASSRRGRFRTTSRAAAGDHRADARRHARRRSCSASRSASFPRSTRNRTADHVLRIVTVAGLAIASFWLALMLQLFFAMELRLAAAAGPHHRLSPADRSPASTVVDALMDGHFTGSATCWPT